ncbi:hypothetical protein GCM10010211_78650 [Streptomyces albospinus]|uniref:Uncharacterized protein n=1 Tax=Streptomyces albospinus TaxID=285515 RepID=A0ABQ2VMJ4_9ACTN|nr:hypothetical protein GCM10010211_78650 [Streptomyces albospinus]
MTCLDPKGAEDINMQAAASSPHPMCEFSQARHCLLLSRQARTALFVLGDVEVAMPSMRAVPERREQAALMRVEELRSEFERVRPALAAGEEARTHWVIGLERYLQAPAEQDTLARAETPGPRWRSQCRWRGSAGRWTTVRTGSSRRRSSDRTPGGSRPPSMRRMGRSDRAADDGGGTGLGHLCSVPGRGCAWEMEAARGAVLPVEERPGRAGPGRFHTGCSRFTCCCA